MEGRAKSKYWWVEDLVDSEAKAMGTYLALLYLLRWYGMISLRSKLSGVTIMGSEMAKSWHALYFAGRGTDARQALEAGTTFIDRLFDHEDVLSYNERNRVLSEIETEFYDKFTKAFKKYLRLDRIPEELKEKAREVLLNVRVQLYGGSVLTPSGTIEIDGDALRNNIKTYQGLEEKDVDKLVLCLTSSGLAVQHHYHYYLFPAPCLSDEVLGLLAKPLEKPPIEVKPLIPPPPKPERFDVKPSREILEGIVASVLKDLGFDVSTNVRKMSRGGGFIEVDVWAQKMVAGMRFSIYVSCRNWDKALDRPFIDEEVGRTLNLVEWPQLKVIVAKELTEPARETAKADGFITIELGKKAEVENAREIYELIYRALNELFTSIAPPRLREIASRIAEVRESLKKVEEELTSLLTK